MLPFLVTPFFRIFGSTGLIHSNGDFIFPGHIVVYTLKHLGAAPSPLREKLEHEQATDDTLTPRGNCNERDTIHTHTHTLR